MHYVGFLLAFGVMYVLLPRFAGGDIPSHVAQVISSALVIAVVCELIYRFVELPMQRVGKTVKRQLLRVSASRRRERKSRPGRSRLNVCASARPLLPSAIV
jgi:peptidoglycan/LPS O-acetylase OafA/YrhL